MGLVIHDIYGCPVAEVVPRHMDQNLAQRRVVQTLRSQVVYSPSMQIESFIQYIAYCLS